MDETKYKLYGFFHKQAKRLLSRQKPFDKPTNTLSKLEKGCTENEAVRLWNKFVENSLITKSSSFRGTHYAGFIEERNEWCLPGWIWTNAAIVKHYCELGMPDIAKKLAYELTKYQQKCGGWIVRNDYDSKGEIPMLAPNDSAYIAQNAFIVLFEITGEQEYLDIAMRCADWIIETARPDGLVYTGYNMRDGKWEKGAVIVDTGFTAGLFAKLVELTNEKRYQNFLDKFVDRYVELFYIGKKKGFCTSIGEQNQKQGGMFARGQAWALEGLIPAYNVLKKDNIKHIIDNTIETLLGQQLQNGGWSYNLTRQLMGEDCKGVPVIAKDIIDWYAVTGDSRIICSARKALDWCFRHTARDGEAIGGIFSYNVEGSIVKNLYTSCAFVYASIYAIELKKLLEQCE